MRRVAAILLLICFAALGTGTLEYLHNLQHAREDAVEAAAAKAAGLPEKSQPAHDETNCDVHAQLHVPLMAAAWVPVLVLLGLFVAFLTQLAPVPPVLELTTRLACRGPPAR